ncbi:GtrA family protein [Catellatospora sichuanensis]|uniref:GtrA family protein n=1 Tax=Catellatospora sichuanensis TaxID=1969805 RepID=UPI001642792C|nr:GtrA family protein [Catellatospora sichuanensis]
MIRHFFRHSAVRYLTVGGLSYVTDAGGLWLLHGVLSVPLGLAATLAFLGAFVVNFGLNRSMVFPSAGQGNPFSAQLVRYVLLVIANYLLTLVLVLGLTGIGMNYLAAKTFAVVVIAVGNYFAYRHWVFAGRLVGGHS